MVNIKGIAKEKVLLALWENGCVQGMSFLGLPSRPLTTKDTKEVIDARLEAEGGHCLYFDYFCGSVIKCDLTGDEFDPWLYDRDCGEGAAQRAVDSIKKDEE